MFRLYWENDPCSKPRKHFCSDHNEVLCSGWFTALHVRCKCNEIPDREDVAECLKVVKTLLTSINENSNIINARSYIKNFDEEFKMYTEKNLKKLMKGQDILTLNHFIYSSWNESRIISCTNFVQLKIWYFSKILDQIFLYLSYFELNNLASYQI